MRTSWRRALAFALALATTRAVGALDRWSHPARAVRYLRRVTWRAGAPRVVHAAFVDLCDPAVEVRATAPGEGGRTVDVWGRAVGAAVAVNGDYFETGTHVPLGPARGGGRWWTSTRREHRDAVLVAGDDGSVRVIDAVDASAASLWLDVKERVPESWRDVVAVRERVLVAGEVRESPAIAHQGERHPRTGVGLSRDAHTLILVVIEGRSETSSGATTRELGETLRALGAWEGMKLDGGGSSTMYVAGRGVVNHPSDGAPRAVANHLGVFVRGDVPADAPRRCDEESARDGGAR